MLFKIWVMFWKTNRKHFSFSAYKTLRVFVTLFFSIFFQSPFSDGKCIPSQLYLFVKVFIFVILSGFFHIFHHDLKWLYWKHLLTFLLIGFIVGWEVRALRVPMSDEVVVFVSSVSFLCTYHKSITNQLYCKVVTLSAV